MSLQHGRWSVPTLYLANSTDLTSDRLPMSIAFLLTRTVTSFHSSVKTARAFLAKHKLRFNGFGEV